jgi:Holliday junction resolvase
MREIESERQSVRLLENEGLRVRVCAAGSCSKITEVLVIGFL